MSNLNGGRGMSPNGLSVTLGLLRPDEPARWFAVWPPCVRLDREGRLDVGHVADCRCGPTAELGGRAG